MDLVEVRGKSTRGVRKVFILMTSEMTQGIDFLINTRKKAGVLPTNPFIFANPANQPIDGCRAFRDLTGSCTGLKQPKSIRSTKLHSYLATTSQILDMTDNELKMLADHMGHDVKIRANYYRLQTSTIEKAKVARVLCAIEQGNVSRFAGKRLAEIEIKDLPVPVEYNDCWNDKNAGETDKWEGSENGARSGSAVAYSQEASDEEPSAKKRKDLPVPVEYNDCWNDENAGEADKWEGSENGARSGSAVAYTPEPRKEQSAKKRKDTDQSEEGDEPDQSEEGDEPSAKKRKVSPRIPWSHQEIKIVTEAFPAFARQYPTSKEIDELIGKFKALQHRTNAQIKSKLQHLKKCHSSSGVE